MIKRRTFWAIAMVAFAILSAPIAAIAQNWPNKTIRIIVGTKPGGSFDRLSRAMAEPLSKKLGVPVVIENRPGAATHVSHVYFFQQPADGNTIITTAANVVARNILQGTASYSMDDLAFINLQWTDYDLIFAGAGSKISSLGELVGQLKKNPASLSVAVITNSSGHLTLVLLLKELGIDPKDVRIVTYDSGSQLRAAMAGGQMDFAITAGDGSITIADVITPLAVVRSNPHSAWKKVPTMNKALSGHGITLPIISGTMRALAVQASFPKKYPDRWKTLVDAFKTILEDPMVVGVLKKQRIGTEWNGPEASDKAAAEAFANSKKYRGVLN
jgi:putative tricarboxylic transport membrane protein